VLTRLEINVEACTKILPKKKHDSRSQLLNAVEQLKPQQKPKEARDNEPNEHIRGKVQRTAGNIVVAAHF